ncbi:MAG: hypothetical protein HY579_13185 [Nitrospinae bacterium]|nr:hypothetical protein [Nitrospinota bacterium]
MANDYIPVFSRASSISFALIALIPRLDAHEYLRNLCECPQCKKKTAA